MQIGSVFARISADNSGFLSGLDKAKSGMKSFADNVKSQASSMSNSLKSQLNYSKGALQTFGEIGKVQFQTWGGMLKYAQGATMSFAKSATNGVRNMANSASSAFSSMWQGVKSFGSAAYGVFGGIAGKVWDIGKGILQWGVGLGALAGYGLYNITKKGLFDSGTLEQSRIAFEVMLGSAGKAKQLLGDISKFSLKTPFEASELREYAGQLLAIGMRGEQIIPTMEMLGNIASGVGKDKLPALVYALGQVKTSGRLMGNDILQFHSAFVPIIEMMSERYGITQQQLRKQIEDGERVVSYADVYDELYKSQAAGGKFYGMMDRQSQTFLGRISNLKDRFSATFMGIIGITQEGDIVAGGFFDRFGQKTALLEQWLKDNQAVIEEWGRKFYNQVWLIGGQVWKFANDQWPELKKQLKDWYEKEWPKLKPKLENFAKTLDSVVEGAKNVAHWIGVIWDIITLRPVVRFADALDEAIGNVAGKLKTVYDLAKGVLEMFGIINATKQDNSSQYLTEEEAAAKAIEDKPINDQIDQDNAYYQGLLDQFPNGMPDTNAVSAQSNSPVTNSFIINANDTGQIKRVINATQSATNAGVLNFGFGLGM